MEIIYGDSLYCYWTFNSFYTALALAASCMIYVTIEDLVPTAVSGEGKNHYGIIAFIIGFLLMMSLDYLLG